MSTQPNFVEQLFEAALALEPDERNAFLDRACNHDPELRRTVEELLADNQKLTQYFRSSMSFGATNSRLLSFNR